MENDQCTHAERLAIIKAAQDRVNFIAWLARALLRTDDILIRREAAAVLLQLTGDE